MLDFILFCIFALTFYRFNDYLIKVYKQYIIDKFKDITHFANNIYSLIYFHVFLSTTIQLVSEFKPILLQTFIYIYIQIQKSKQLNKSKETLQNSTVKMPQQFLGKTIKSFNITKQLGQGQFASVFEALDDRNKSIVAVKIMSMERLNKNSKLKSLVQTQIAVLKQCRNPNVIAYIDSFETNGYLFIVIQYCNGGTLEDYIVNQQKLTQDQAVVFLKHILNGFKGLHEVHAMHRDFKCANVLLHNGQCKIADLGFAIQMEQNQFAKTICGTSLTMAPEVLEEKQYGFQADIWSIGVVFYQMIYGMYPYRAKTDYQLMKIIKERRPDYQSVNISDNAKDFIQKCLIADPKSRITWKQIYKHPLIKSKNNKNAVTVQQLKSKLSLNKNETFYQQLDLQHDRSFTQVPLQSARALELQVIPDNDFRLTPNPHDLQKITQRIKNDLKNVQKFDKLYVNKRNDLMIFTKYIQPYLDSFSNLKINHSVAAFIMAKKYYVQMKKFNENLTNYKKVFPNQKGFQQYSKLQSYKKLITQTKQDEQTLRKSCELYKSRIKLTIKQVSNQLPNIQKYKFSNYDGVMANIIHQYLVMLSQCLDYVKKQNKNNLVKTIYALNYLWNNQKPREHQLDRMLSSTNLEGYEKLLRNRYGCHW